MSRTARLVAAAVLAAAVLPAVGGGSTGATAADPMYRPLSDFAPSGDRVRIAPDHYSAVRVDLGRARAQLSEAPRASARAGLVFSVPTPTGGTERFTVKATRTMEPKLAAAHPEIATYAGRSLDNDGTTIALDVTPMGMHAAVRGPQGQRAWYVDPAYDRPGTKVHLSYYGGAVPRAEEAFVEREAPEIRKVMRERQARLAPGGEVTQKVYRLAFATDPSYAAYFGTDNVLAEKVTLINRVNQIYNDDLAIRMVLIDETDDLNLDTEAKATGINGPCGSHPCFDPGIGDPEDDDYIPGHLDTCDVGTLGRNRIVLGQIVGAANYDVGHIGLGKNGGGIAYLGVVGWDYKGGGCTGLPEPKGDFFAIDYVAHELGHQYSGNHTFFACGGGNNGPTGIEPGSGSTVMAYAGICGTDDLQPHTDPYFSAATVDEVNAYTNNPTLPVVEVQTVSLTGFGPTDTLTLGFDGDTAPITFDDYTPENVEDVVEDLTGEDVSIADWGYDPFFDFPSSPPDPDDFDETGFQVIFSSQPFPDEPGTATFEDFPSLTVGGAGVSGFVGETAKGGTAANGGDEQVETGNRAPTVRAPAAKTLPIQTPFTLKALGGKDADGHDLTYLWEQLDWGNSAIALTSNKKTRGPLFRVFGVAANVTDEGTLQSPSPGLNLADGNPSRTFPDMLQVLNGNTNAKTGACPKFRGGQAVPMRLVNCYSEFLPTNVYKGNPGQQRPAMHFRVSVRDGFEDGGGLGYDEVTLRIARSAGPFLVTSLARGDNTLRAGRGSLIEWKVNGTKQLAKNVRILLSTNGGKTWSRTLASSTPNDGKAKVRIPRVKTKQARIMIAANGNYFFDVNDKAFRIK
ncbi:MAG TPA: M12 family metallo-peptidase [Nocardioides sp.]|nr:M12 family metallo-peptidase [Nocardioides sp.]